MAALQRRVFRAPLCLDFERGAFLRADVLAFPAVGLGASFLAASALAASGLASVLVSALVSVFASTLASSFSGPARLRLFSLSDLKSVSYQPEPLRRKTGADISLRRPFLPQFGHFVSGASVIFCSTS